jgi:hypothetical protein
MCAKIERMAVRFIKKIYTEGKYKNPTAFAARVGVPLNTVLHWLDLKGTPKTDRRRIDIGLLLKLCEIAEWSGDKLLKELRAEFAD